MRFICHFISKLGTFCISFESNANPMKTFSATNKSSASLISNKAESRRGAELYVHATQSGCAMATQSGKRKRVPFVVVIAQVMIFI